MNGRIIVSLILILLVPLLITCNSNLTLGIDNKMELDDTIPPGFEFETDRDLSVIPRATAAGVHWVKAVDNLCEQNELEYKLVYSQSEDIADAVYAESLGTTAIDWTADICDGDISGLNVETDYFVTVLVRDKAGLITSYRMQTCRTLTDTVAPVISSPLLTVSDINMEDVTVSWTKATDLISPQYTLEYRIYYLIDGLSDKNEIYGSGTGFGNWNSDIMSLKVTGLTDAKDYSFTVAVKDEAGNVSLYNTADAHTEKHPRIFYTASSSDEVIRSCNIDGTNQISIVDASGGDPFAISVDSEERKIYWTDTYFETISRADFDGSNIEVLIENQNNPRGIAVDPVNRYLYWTDADDNTIHQSGLPPSSNAGGDFVILDGSDGIDTPVGIDVDLNSGQIYWTEQGNGGGTPGIYKSDKDSHSRIAVIAVSVNEPVDLALDYNNSIIYWTDDTDNSVISRTYSAGIFNYLIDTNIDKPWGISLDFAGNLYWVDAGLFGNKMYVSPVIPDIDSDADSYSFFAINSSPCGIDIY